MKCLFAIALFIFASINSAGLEKRGISRVAENVINDDLENLIKWFKSATIVEEIESSDSLLIKPEKEQIASAQKDSDFIDAFVQLYLKDGRRKSKKQLAKDAKEAKQKGKQASKQVKSPISISPISSGIGFDLLKKMGWEEGEGLGKSKAGMQEPIMLPFRLPTDKRGIGSAILPPPKRFKAKTGGSTNKFASLSQDFSNIPPLDQRFVKGGLVLDGVDVV